ncbi:hypothetical protein ACIRPQ_29295 [Streptomyces sp. NPDC101213]|uniref:hypothetical protein n=1 Tax=Streptomyces sp. NPDC101213 TaxID=3366130 RepID=UPI0037F5DCBA
MTEERMLEVLREAEVFAVRHPEDGEVPMVKIGGVYVSVALEVDDDGCPTVSIQVDHSDAAGEMRVGARGTVPTELVLNGKRVWDA